MNADTIIQLVVSILTALVVVIPLVQKLVEYVKAAVREKNWPQVLELVTGYMKTAEEKFEDGATRKEWVMGMISSSAATINYDIDMDRVSKLIDDLCAMSKIVNAEAAKNQEAIEEASE